MCIEQLLLIFFSISSVFEFGSKLFLFLSNFSANSTLTWGTISRVTAILLYIKSVPVVNDQSDLSLHICLSTSLSLSLCRMSSLSFPPLIIGGLQLLMLMLCWLISTCCSKALVSDPGSLPHDIGPQSVPSNIWSWISHCIQLYNRINPWHLLNPVTTAHLSPKRLPTFLPGSATYQMFESMWDMSCSVITHNIHASVCLSY